MRRTGPNAEIPTSSTADIAFLLIVFFMLTSVFAATQGLDFALPEEDQVLDVDPVRAILVEVGEETAVAVDGVAMGSAEAAADIAAKLRLEPGKPVILRTSGSARYRDMMTVYDRLRGLHLEQALPAPLDIAIPTEREIAAYWR